MTLRDRPALGDRVRVRERAEVLNSGEEGHVVPAPRRVARHARPDTVFVDHGVRVWGYPPDWLEVLR